MTFDHKDSNNYLYFKNDTLSVSVSIYTRFSSQNRIVIRPVSPTEYSDLTNTFGITVRNIKFTFNPVVETIHYADSKYIKGALALTNMKPIATNATNTYSVALTDNTSSYLKVSTSSTTPGLFIGGGELTGNGTVELGQSGSYGYGNGNLIVGKIQQYGTLKAQGPGSIIHGTVHKGGSIIAT